MRISDWSSDVCSSDLGVADDLVAVLDLAGAADVEADRGIEFQRVAARRRLGIAVHHADLHAKLVDEDHHAARAADRTAELTQALRHQPRLHADMTVAHHNIEPGTRPPRCDRLASEECDRCNKGYR